MLCKCGNELTFMGYYSQPGLSRLLVQLGCTTCWKNFYYVAESRREISLIPRMNQLDYDYMSKHGILDVSYTPEEHKTYPSTQLLLFGEAV